ncbi:MAG: hypothetical protein HOP30_15490 [Cyclobacteriaceae bacterium]|nr:hypothetical protein [Cyclobacteriaceae bacterium]
MNLLESLKKSPSPAQYKKMIEFIGADKQRFSELISIYLKGPERITQRASTLLVHFAKKQPELIIGQLSILLKHLEHPHASVAIKRNSVRFLQDIAIPKRWQGKVTDICFSFLTSHQESIAVKAFSMTVLANIAIENSELKNELIPIIEDQMPFGSAGFRNRGAKVLKQLATR